MSGVQVLMPVSATGPAVSRRSGSTAAGWAVAGRRLLGDAVVFSPDGVYGPEAALEHSVDPRRGRTGQRRSTRRIPLWIVTLLNDLRSAADAMRFRRSWRGFAAEQGSPTLIWQQHGLFQNIGRLAARSTGAPLVVFVDAPVVWEAR